MAATCKRVKAILLLLHGLSCQVASVNTNPPIECQLVYHEIHFSQSAASIMSIIFGLPVVLPLPRTFVHKAQSRSPSGPISRFYIQPMEQPEMKHVGRSSQLKSCTELHVADRLHPAPMYGIMRGGGPANCIFALSPLTLSLSLDSTVCTPNCTRFTFIAIVNTSHNNNYMEQITRSGSECKER